MRSSILTSRAGRGTPPPDLADTGQSSHRHGARHRGRRALIVGACTALTAAGLTLATAGTALAGTAAGTSDPSVTVTVPDEVTVGSEITVSGTGWKNQAGDAGSVVAFKLDEGGVTTTRDVVNPVNGQVQGNKTIWAIAQADASGSFTATFPFPDSSNSNVTWASGETHSVRLLTGSLLTGDKIRSESGSFSVVEAAPVGQQLTLDKTTASPGDTITASLTGASPNTVVSWSLSGLTVPDLSIGNTDADGKASVTFTLPAGIENGAHKVLAVPGFFGQDLPQSSAILTVTGGAQRSPAISGHASLTVQAGPDGGTNVAGVYFPPNEVVTETIDGTIPATLDQSFTTTPGPVTTDEVGSWNGQARVPASVTNGPHTMVFSTPSFPEGVALDIVVTGGAEPPAGSDTETITATVPQVGAGEFSWTITGTDHAVVLTDAVNKGAYLESTGDLVPVTVTDTRTGGPSWSISGQLGDFNSGALSGKYLGWTPAVQTAGAGATAGSPVASGFDSGNGLADAASLASAAEGHDAGSATVGAGLDLKVPANTPAGTYTATLTLTALS